METDINSLPREVLPLYPPACHPRSITLSKESRCTHPSFPPGAWVLLPCLTAMAVFSPVSAWASCVNKTNGDGTHTITCCGETSCYYTTWRGLTLIDEGTLP